MEKRSSERQRRRAKKLAHIRKQREELMNLERELGKFKENSMSTALPFSPSPQNSPLRAKTPKKSPLMPSPQNSPMRVKTPKKSPLMERTPTKSPLQENSPRSSPRIQFYQPLSSRLSPSPKKVSSRISPSPKKTPPQRVQRQGSSVLSAVRKQLSGIDDILSPKRRNSVEKKAKIKASPASADFESMRKRNKSAANFLSQQNSKNSPAPAPSPERPRALPFTEAKVSPESKTAPKTIDVSAAVLQGKEDLIEIKDCVSEKEASSKDKGETRSKDSESQWYNSKVDKIIEVWSPQKGEPETSNLSADSLAGAFSVEGDLTLDAAEVLAGLGNADVDPEDQMKEEEGTFESSALRIQAFWRGAAERKYRLTLLNKRTKNAVILIQRCFRGWCCRSKLALEGTGSTLAGEDTDVGSPNSQTAGSFVDDYMVGVHNYVINGLIMNQTVESAYQCSPGTNSMMLNNSEMVSFSESNFGATPGKISPVPKMVDTSLMGHAALQEEMNSVMKQEVNPDETLSDAEEVLALDESALLLNESLKTIRKQMADAEEEVSAHRVTSPMEDVEAEMDAAATWETRPIGDQLLRRKHAFQKQRFKMEEANKHLGGTSPSSIREVPSSPYASKLLMRKYEHQQKRNDEKSEVAFVAYSPLREESSPIASRLMRRKFTRGVSAIPSKKSDSTPEEGVSSPHSSSLLRRKHKWKKTMPLDQEEDYTGDIPELSLGDTKLQQDTSSPAGARLLVVKNAQQTLRSSKRNFEPYSPLRESESSPVSSRLLRRKTKFQSVVGETTEKDTTSAKVESSPFGSSLLRRKSEMRAPSHDSTKKETNVDAESSPFGSSLLRRKSGMQTPPRDNSVKETTSTDVESSPFGSSLLRRKSEMRTPSRDSTEKETNVDVESSPFGSSLLRRKSEMRSPSQVDRQAVALNQTTSSPLSTSLLRRRHEFQKQQHASAAAATDAIPSSPNATRILMRKHEIFKERQLVSSTDDFSIPAPATSSPVSSRLLQRKLEIQKSQSEANGHDFNNFSVDISTPEKSSPISFELLRRKHAAMRGSIESMQTATLETSPASSILWEKKRMNQRNQESNLKEGDEGASASLQSRAVEMTDNEIPVDSPIAQFNLSKFDNPLGRRQKEAILVVARRRNLMKFPKQGDNELNAPSVRHSVASMEMSNSGKSNSVRGPEGKSGASLIMEMKIQREKLEARRDAQKRKKYNDRVSRGKKVLLNILGANEEILPGQQMSGTREAIDDLDADYVLNTSMNQVEESGEEAVVASLFVDERPSLQENLLPFGVHRNTAPEKDEMPHASPIKEMNVHDVQAEADMVPVRQLIAAVQPVRRRSVAMTFDMTDDGPCESRNFTRKKKMPKVRKPVRSAETAPIAVHEVVKQEVVQKPVEVQKPKIENFDMKKFMNPYEYREEEAKKNPQVMTFDMHNHDDGGHGPEVRKLKIMEARERKIAKLKRRQALQEKRKQIRAEERKLLKEKKMKKEQRIKDVQSHDMMGIVGSRWRPEDEAKDNLNREQEAWANVEQEVNYLGEEEPLNLEGIIPMSEIELHMSDEAPLRHKSRLRQPSAGLQYQRESAMRAAAAAMENPARGISKSRAAKATARRYGGKGGGSGDGFSDVPERSRRYAPPGKRNGAVMLPRKLAGPSNRKKVFLALKNVCLAGAHLAYEHGDARRAIENSTASSFVVLMGNTRALNYRGLYAKNPITKVQTRIHGTGPEVLEPHMITEYFKYSTSVRNFQAIPGTKDFTATTDAVTVKPKFLKKTRKFSSGLDYRDQVFEKLDHHRGRVQLM